MLRTVLSYAACLLLLPLAHAAAMSDAEFARALRPAQAALTDSRYKLVERKAHQTLDILKTLREYSRDVKDASERLRDEMLDNRYEDWVNIRLTAPGFEAKSNKETVEKTYDLEKGSVERDLRSAKAGEFEAIEQDLARIEAFEADYEARVKANEAKISAVRAAYARHFGNAKTALAELVRVPVVQELLAAKPKLVKEIKLASASLRPLVWRIDFVKENGDYNDPRYAQVPRTVSVQDGSETITYAVLIRK